MKKLGGKIGGNWWLIGEDGNLLGDGGKIGGEKKCDGRTNLQMDGLTYGRTDQPTDGHLTWVGARDACASKNGTAPHSMQQLHCTMWCTALYACIESLHYAAIPL